MFFLKRNIKRYLISKQHTKYRKEVDQKNVTYDSWIRKKEKELKIFKTEILLKQKSLTNDFGIEAFDSSPNQNAGNYSNGKNLCQLATFFDSEGRKNTFLVISAENLCRNEGKIFDNCIPDFVIVLLYEGQLNDIALPLIGEAFWEDENVILIYGDEDQLQEGVRKNPWFKPDWSPDSFLSSFYFGALTAVRADILRDAFAWKKNACNLKKDREDPSGGWYELLGYIIEAAGGFRCRSVSREDAMPVKHIPQVLFHSDSNGYEQIRDMRLFKEHNSEETDQNADFEREAFVSVIIPSKDNPRALFVCLDSLLEKTSSDVSYEIILVDNGSGQENRLMIEEKIGRINENAAFFSGFSGCRYLYEPMTFNFSKMCNIGARAAGGDLLLFLNDDMEILQPDWLKRLTEKAVLHRAGAVGAKLLYPDSSIIQHAGITNLRVGPAHKLQYLDDTVVRYFGRNRGVHNMLAVTGACLMVKKSTFWQVGGFPEELAVAFNDVDLCYSLYEAGYYNIVRNDVTLYHHESLSRGKDGESEEKQQRLLREKDLLYERHQDLYGRDPFYHPYLTTDMLEAEYMPAYHYQVTLDMPWAEAVPALKTIKRAREDQCLVVGIECALDIYKWQYGVSPDKGKVQLKPEDMGFYFQGYSFVIGSDNACYRKKLLLRNKKDGSVWAISVDNRYRQDIKNNLQDQLNVDLTGFAAKLRSNSIPAGIYQFGMLAEDTCSRQRLVNWSSWVLEIGSR